MAYSDDNPFAPGGDDPPVATLDLDPRKKKKPDYSPANPFAPKAPISDDEIRSIEAEARGEKPQLPTRVPRPQPAPDLAQAPRDVTATKTSPQSAPNLPNDAQALRADLFRQTPYGIVDAAVPQLIAGTAEFIPHALAHPVETAEQAVTAIPRAVGAAFRTGEAVSKAVHDTGAPAPDLKEAGSELLGAGMDVAALAIPGAEGIGALVDRSASKASQAALFAKLLENAKARGTTAAEGKALWAREQGMRDATDAAYEEYKGTHPMQALLNPGQYEMGPASVVSRETPEQDPARLLTSRAVGAGIPTEGELAGPGIAAPAVREPVTDPARLLAARAVGAGTPTEGTLQGPGIPSPDSFAAALERASAEHLNATPEDINAYRGLRDSGMDTQSRALGAPRPFPGEPLDRFAARVQGRAGMLERNAIAADDQIAAPLRAMDGRLKRNLGKVSDADLEAEHQRLSELQGTEAGEIQAMRDNPAHMTALEMGPGMKEDARGALEEGELYGRTGPLGMQQGRVTQRQKAIDRIAAEIQKRRAERGDDESPTDFNFGGNRRGVSAAGPLAMIVGTGTGAAIGAAAAPPGQREEGAAAGAMAGLGITALGAHMAEERLPESAASIAARAAEDKRADAGYPSRTIPRVPESRVKETLARGTVIDMGEDGLGLDPEPARRTGAVGDVAKGEVPERIQSAAVRTPDGKIYTGALHVEAMDKAEAAGGPPADQVTWPEEDQGYVTTSGKWLSREQAEDHALAADVDMDPFFDERGAENLLPALRDRYAAIDEQAAKPRRRTGAVGDVGEAGKEKKPTDPEFERIRAKVKAGGEMTDRERTYIRTGRAPEAVVPAAAPAAEPAGGPRGSRMAPRTPEERASMERKAELGARSQRGSETPSPKAVADAVEAAYSPATRSAQASTAAAGWRQKRGEMDHDLAVAQHGLESIANGLERETVPNKLAFMHAIETGAKQPNPKYQPVADAIRKGLDAERDRIRALGTGKLDNYLENYFPHLWQDPQKASGVLGAITGKRPMRGSMAWEKQRKIPTIEEGIKAGLVPVSYNPIELTMLKLRDMRKYRMATEVVSDLEGRGLITQALTDKDKIPEGYAALTHDPSFRNRYAPEPVARVLNNALSPGLRGNAAYDAFMAVGNTLNRAQLGLSAFHAGMTTIEQMVSQNALAVSHLFSGQPLEAAKKFVTFPIAPITQFAKGAKLARAYLADPATLDPAMRVMVDQVTAAGGRFKSAFADEESKALRSALDAKQYGKAATHLLPAVLEKATAPIMEHLVPRQKFGVFYDLAQREIERLGEGAHPDEVRAAVQKAWDSVDNRLGQVVYDNLFWNKATKDLLHAGVRSVGWNWGTFRELGGGTKDAAGFVKDLLTPGRKAELSTRAQYAIALPITVGLLGAVTQYLYTGKGPETLFDYFHPQTGTLDADGNPNRVVLPTYMKDVFAYGRDFQEGKPLRTLGNKLNPMLSMVAGMLQNRDFYGNEIRNPDDPFFTKLGQLAKYVEKEAMPFSVQNLTELGKRGASTSEKALTMVGVTPANRAAVRTPAQNKMAEYRDLEHRTETPEQVEASDAKGKAVADLKAGNAGPIAALERTGGITRAQLKAAEHNVGANRLATSFRALPLEQMEHVYALATPSEKAIWLGIIEKKRAKSRTLAPQEP